MDRLKEILNFNRQFVKNKEYEPLVTTKFPDKKMVIVTCMDTRLVELLPRALNLKNGDAKIIKTAGALISHPFDSTMRSVLVALTMLKAEEVYVIGHLDCGMIGLKGNQVIEQLKNKGLPTEKVHTLRHAGIDVDHWLNGCEGVEQGVLETVQLIKNHPLLPPGVLVHGLTIDPHTGELALIHEDQQDEE
ncbi:beta-class carbonic anhydrase [Thermoflavimicrobium dichotomicum]|uniref:carbonic anhydrase n=1 Tax=Thermoflavimicrobium dichotomicum TaxID=46223 RepID=A0A1I3NEQ5_9BACL|nr:carbonic anhydrase [Thermoflavimicrobium dichotomicum]SFJ07597.1 carbonic anhydrase [Thermoflavimicrobium dichotomicum]